MKRSILFFVFLSACQSRPNNDEAIRDQEADAFADVRAPVGIVPRDGSVGNDTPPDEYLIEEAVPYPPQDIDAIQARIDRLPLTEVPAAQSEIDAAITGRAEAAQIRLAMVDQYGTFYARADQKKGNARVQGGEVIYVRRPDGMPEIHDTLVANVITDPVPGVGSERVIPAAELLYPEAPHTTAAELVIVPDVTGGMLLEWHITLTPIVTGTEGAEANDDDAATREAAQGGDDEPARTFDRDAAAGLPTMIYRYSAATGDFIGAEDTTAFEGPNCNLPGQMSVGEGFGHYNGKVPLRTLKDGNLYKMIDRTHTGLSCNEGNKVFHAFGGTGFTGSMFNDSNNVWGTGIGTGFDESVAVNTSAAQTPAADVMFGIQVTQDMFRNVLGRVGFDGKGSSVTAFVHYDKFYNDARSNGGASVIMFGDGGETDALLNAGSYSLGTVAHELGHELYARMGHDGGSTEARAINEGFGDAQAAFVDIYHRTHRGQGQSLHHVIGSWRGRTLNPEGYSERNKLDPNCPKTLDPLPESCKAIGQRYYTSETPNTPEHSGGIPFTRAVMHLAEGSDTVPGANYYSSMAPGLAGIGTTKAAKIFYTAFAQYAAKTPSYVNARNAFILAAQQLYGPNSPEHNATRNAWAAIGLGAYVTGTKPPVAAYAGIYDVDQKGRVATMLVLPQDDTGSAKVRMSSHGNEVSTLGGYALETISFADTLPGKNDFDITLVDSDQNQTKVVRSLITDARDVLTKDSSFEKGINSSWKRSGGDLSSTIVNQQICVTGNACVSVRGSETIYQDVTIPTGTNGANVTYFVSVLPGVRSGESLRVELQNTDGTFLALLGEYKNDFATAYAGKLNGKNYLKVQRDIYIYLIGRQKVRLAFVGKGINPVGNGANRFLVDHAIITRTEKLVPDTQINVFEPDHTLHVSTQLNYLRGDYKHIVYRFGPGRTVIGDGSVNNEIFTSTEGLTQGNYSLKGTVIGHDDSEIGTFMTNFTIEPYKELLQNPGFEGESGWEVSLGEGVGTTFLSNGPDLQFSYRGEGCLMLGGTGEDKMAGVRQLITIPADVKTLEVSLRVKTTSNLPPTAETKDRLLVYLKDKDGPNLYGVAVLDPRVHGDKKIEFTNEWNAVISGKNIGGLDLEKVRGKQVYLELRSDEDGGGRQTTWYIDEASVHYTSYGRPPTAMDASKLPEQN